MNRRLALVIGNTEYQDQPLARLVSPHADVKALADVLRAADVGGFAEVRTLLNETATTIRREIARFLGGDRNRDDLLLLYFSGHGVKNARGELYLAVADTETDLLGATAIPASFVSDEMDTSGSRRVVLVLDCCHSGAFLRGAKGAAGDSVDTRGVFEGTGSGRVIITATDSIQYAWEGDQVTGQAQTSLFTTYLVQGLRSGAADLDADGQITVDELYEYVYREVVKHTSVQRPRKFAINQEGELVIAQVPRSNAKPVDLPSELLVAMSSLLPGAREDAVRELDGWLRSGHAGRAVAAERALHQLAQDDSRRVAAAAEASLEAHAARPHDRATAPIPDSRRRLPGQRDAPQRVLDGLARLARSVAVRPSARLMGVVLAVVFALALLSPLAPTTHRSLLAALPILGPAALGMIGASLMVAGSPWGRRLALPSLVLFLGGVVLVARTDLLVPLIVLVLALSVSVAISRAAVVGHRLTGRSIALIAAISCLALTPSAYSYLPRPPPVGPPSPTPPATPAEPQRIERPLPAARQEGAAVVVDNRLYVTGGFGATTEGQPISQPTTYVFDGVWRTGPDLSAAVDHPGGAALGGAMYVAGGFTNLHPGTARVFRLDSSGWSELRPMHHARGALALIELDNRLYALGGSSDHNEPGEVAPGEVYDPATNTWTDLPPLPRPRNHVAGFVYLNRLVCVAGGHVNGGYASTTAIDCYDPASRGWSTPLPALPISTSSAGAGVLGSELIVAGGQSSAIVDRIMRIRIDVQGAQWRTEAMIVPRHGIELAPYQGRLWACGGSPKPGSGAVADCTSIGRS